MNTKKMIPLVIAMCLILSACFPAPPAPTATPEPTFTAVPTFTPAPTATLAPTLTPEPTFTPVVVDIQVSQPIEGAKVNQIQAVEGTSLNIPDGSVIWVVIYLPIVRRYYPQDFPADIQVNNDWSTIVTIGQPGEVGLQADIIAVLADKSAQDVFNAYLQDAKSKNNFPGLEKLPDSALIYQRVSVVRK